MPTLQGHCNCGALSYTLDASPSNLRLSAYCHCTRCQRINGAPYIWTTHWAKNAVTWSSHTSTSGPTQVVDAKVQAIFGGNVTTAALYESAPGRKFKLRCSECGNPMGSWNSAKQQWSIWPSTLARPDGDKCGLPGTETFPPTAHMFYGSWKVATVTDDLPKFVGYPNESQQVDRNAEPLPSNFNVNDFNPHDPREMVGYGPNPPHPKWPKNARIAVSFVVNYEEGGENLTLNGDTGAEQYLTEYGAANGSKPPAGIRNLSVESAYEFGSHRGFWRILDLFKRNGLKFTSWSVGRAVEQNPAVVKAMEEAGCEVASHSYRWFDHSLMSQEEERAQIQAAIKAIKTASPSSREPRGWYTGRQSINTRRLVYQIYKELGLHNELYDSDAYDEDLPYWVPAPDGTPNEHLLVVPYTLDNNDMRFAITPGFFNSDSFASYLIDAFETLVAETYLDGTNPMSVPKMMSVGLHCRVVGRPGKFAGLQKFVNHVISRNKDLLAEGNGVGGVWVATREEIANHWRTTHPPKNT
ncbi:related to Chitin deacetylase 1 [Melanopsichium pennsylvanicum]|uniref:Related to Chitin deacetylase 1 n=2 Tax=Melanopsichium pennsylvanicum TaxID=63383 RepID=A0AAJ5C2H7_9BASI|nr:related to Chitin deacetylase 1 [Melanopsichium pennsylvanicum 4]SNX81434.1 related to Chitin deacetylase 1 [Melanopsichium pennsylvanicum]